MTNRYQHDHDEELGCYWYGDSPPSPATNTPNDVPVDRPHARRRRVRDEAYWNETASLVAEYFELRAGVYDSEMLLEGFIAWVQRSPGELRLYMEGDDMTRAALVDWYLKVVR